MKISSLDPWDWILAFDRLAKCYRLAQAIDTEILNGYGEQVTDYEAVDTERGELIRKLPNGKKVKVLGTFRVVVREDAAEKLKKTGR